MKAIQTYREECLKQTDPYAYFLQKQAKEKPERGNAISIEGPLPCFFVSEGPGGLNLEEYRIDNKETYVILKGAPAVPYEGAERMLLTEGWTRGINTPGHQNQKLYPDLIYCDHDHRDRNGKRHTPFLKPDPAKHTLLFDNYMGSFLAVRKEMLRKVLTEEEADGFRQEGCSARDWIYIVALRICAVSDNITHVAKILFSYPEDLRENELYRRYTEAAAGDPVSKERRIAMRQMGVTPKEHYSLSVIIPSKDNADVLIRCIESLKINTRFNHGPDSGDRIEILIIDNGSYPKQKEDIEAYVAQNAEWNLRYIYHPETFNFSRMCHRGAQAAKGDLLLFLNDDVEATAQSDLEKMCLYASAPTVGAVGAKLLYPGGNLIQHAGITNLTCGPTHKLSGFSDSEVYYFGVNAKNRNVLAVTGACLMVSREKYFHVNGFHDKMSVSYNDVDLCVNLLENGLPSLLLNDCVFLHHESLSRGSDLADEKKIERLSSERALFYKRHPQLADGSDPFYHPDLIPDLLEYRVNVAADYEIRRRMSDYDVILHDGARHSRNLMLTVEKAGVEKDLLGEGEDAFFVSGWTLYRKHDERFYDRYLLLFFPGEEKRCIRISMMPVYREDVSKVFAGEKNASLAGFYVRIPSQVLDPSLTYKVAVLYVHRIFRHQIITLGADYEPGKGYEGEGGAVL